MPRSGPTLSAAAIWLGVGAATTALLWLLRDDLDKAHMSLAYLVLVLAASSRQGRLLGLMVAVLSFLSFNFFLLPPYYTLRLADPLDWGVLAAFLLSGGIAAQLFHRQQVATELAEQRGREVGRLSALGAESLSVGRAAEAVDAIARVIESELRVQQARIDLTPPPGPEGIGAALRRSAEVEGEGRSGPEDDLQAFVVRERRVVSRRADGTVHMGPAGFDLEEVLEEAEGVTDVLLPLTVRDHCVGVLRLSDGRGLRFAPGQAAFADALVYFAALAAERVRLAQEADHVEALREADRLKDALLASVSHDLRTPLTTIRATAQELRREGEERGALLEEEAERLNRMVADILDLSRLRAGALPLVPEINAAEDLVGAALQRVSGTPGAGEIGVTLPPGDLLVGLFDFTHALRALTNLVENALRHSPRPGSVAVDVGREGDELLFRVMDRGTGVASADRPRLFEPFFRSASASGTQGTGLGLSIAARIAEAHGGTTTYAPRPGGGSIFTLRLPAAELPDISS